MNKLIFETGYATGVDSAETALDKMSEDLDGAIAYIYCNYYPMMKTWAKKFRQLSSSDTESYALECIYTSLQTFKPDAGVKFSTFLTRCWRNKLVNEAKAVNTKCHTRDWYMRVDLESGYSDEETVSALESISVDGGQDDQDLYSSVEQLSLSNNEYLVLNAIISGGPLVSNRKIGEELGLSGAAVANIKKRLSEKVSDLL